MIIKQDPKALLIHQIKSMYLGGISETTLNKAYPLVLAKLDHCFSHISNKYYHQGKETLFNPLHVAQWTMFLYEMAHEIGRSGDVDLCDKIYGISKMISSADIFYGVSMPDIWFFDHPQGSVMGRAEYSDYFSFSQNCTVGNNKGVYPRFGKHVSMMSGSKVLGNCNIGDYVIMAANSYVIDQDIPSYSIVFGMGKNTVIHNITHKQFNDMTGSMFDNTEEKQGEKSCNNYCPGR